MKLVVALVVLLGAFLAAMGMVLGSPSHKTGAAVLIGLAFGTAITLILRGPLGKALVSELKGDDAASRDTLARISAQLDELSDDVRLGREEVAELQERVDFTERLLARQADQASLLEPRERS